MIASDAHARESPPCASAHTTGQFGACDAVEEVPMAVHLTLDELSEATGLSRREVLRLCVQEAVPILNGRVDRTLFVSSVTSGGRRLPLRDAEVVPQ